MVAAIWLHELQRSGFWLEDYVAGGTISGRVVDTQDQAIPGAAVSAVPLLDRYIGSPPEIFTTVSDPSGVFRLPAINQTDYSLQAKAPGFAPAQTRKVHAPHGGIILVLSAGATFTGKVVSSSGSPIQGAEARAFRSLDTTAIICFFGPRKRPPPLETVKSGPDGRFVFRSLEVGAHDIVISAPGFAPKKMVRVPVRKDGAEPLAWTLEAGMVISGMVLSATGQQVAGAEVRASSRGSDHLDLPQNWNACTTGARGEFVIDTLEPGTYDLLASHPDHSFKKITGVEAGGEPVIIRLSPGIEFSGSVAEAVTGKAIAGALISLSDPGGVRKECFTDTLGAFAIKGLDPSSARKYFLEIQAEGYAWFRNGSVIVGGEGPDTGRTFVLELAARIRGRVLDRAGKPICRAVVRLGRRTKVSPALITMERDETDDEGRFRMAGIEAGDGNALSVSAPGFLPAEGAPFELRRGESIALPEIVLLRGAIIEGQVIGPDGAGAGGVQVSVDHPDELNMPDVPRVLSDTSGMFSLSGLPSTTVDLVARAPGMPPAMALGLRVIEGQVTRGVTIRLQEGGEIRGVVRDADRRPIRGAVVRVLEIGDQGMRELETVSGPRGVFRLEGLPAQGTVEVTVSCPEFLDFSDERVPVNTQDLQVVLGKRGDR